MSSNLYDLLRGSFEKALSTTALEIPERGIFTYEKLIKETNRFAQWLYNLGIEPGDRVAVQAEKSPEIVFLYLACLKTGAVYLPLNTAYPYLEIEFFLNDAEPRILVCDPSRFNHLQPKAKNMGVITFSLDEEGCGSLADELGDENKTPAFNCKEDDLAAILYTSGTTGRAKGAMITHGNLASNALTLHRQWGFVKGDVLLHALPIFHVHGLFVALHCALLNASKIIFLSRYDTKKVLEWLPEASIFMGVPTYYTRLLSHKDFHSSICSSIRLFISGSAPLLKETFKLFSQKTGHVILERYGMTEAGMITSNPLDQERRAGTVGFPLNEVMVRICNEDGLELEDGITGMLEIKGPNLFKGYWKLPEQTRKEFCEDGYFITGDLAVRDKQGYISIVGRAKDLIISGGLNVYPKEIEERLDQYDGVEESAVFGLLHEDLGEAVTAVVASKKWESCDEESLLTRLREQVAEFKLPKRILFTKELPRNSMGKILKNVLREEFQYLYKKNHESLISKNPA